jgi:hypothetical protein
LTQPRTFPQAREYQDAIQAPTLCFTDPRLKAARIHMDNMGMPQTASGKSAIVFKATADGKDVAIRCFTRAASDQRMRYLALEKYLELRPSYLVGFDYRDAEILVAKTRYPLVEMDWVDGDPLDKWVERHLERNGNLGVQAAAWRDIVGDMLKRKIAHGDIANDNCMVSGSQLKLVDYDGCYIPDLRDRNPGESGAQHFQHPNRGGYYADNMDAFPSLVVYLSLAALHADPSLWKHFHKDKNLIFHADDYKKPQQTPIWHKLAQSPDTRVRSLAVTLARMCREQVNSLRSLPDVLAEEPPVWEQIALQNRATGTRKASPPAPRQTPPPSSTDWIRDHWPNAAGHQVPAPTVLRPTPPSQPRPTPPTPTPSRPAPPRPTAPGKTARGSAARAARAVVKAVFISIITIIVLIVALAIIGSLVH